MKVLLLSDPNSIHTIRWARSLAESGLDILIFGLSYCDGLAYKNHNIEVETFGFDISIIKNEKVSLSKIRYLKAVPKLKKIIRKFKPNILHAHYATSYGLIGALSGFHPFVLSVWGTDVFDFPNKSFFHKKLLEFNLSKADRILSTSHVMARETGKYTDKEIEVTPFGVDLDVFAPEMVEGIFSRNDIVIGTVKTLEEKYGIEYLIKAFNIVKEKHPDLPLKLLIVGGGSLESNYKNLIKELGLVNDTCFVGQVSHDEVPKYHNMISIFVAVSIYNSESFGVAVIEASACQKPVVVSNVGGLPEVVEDGVTGIVVPPRDPQKTAEAIEKLLLDKNLREQMGKSGRERVKKLYDWDENVKQMIGIYNNLKK